jgi:hypothetical protein
MFKATLSCLLILFALSFNCFAQEAEEEEEEVQARPAPLMQYKMTSKTTLRNVLNSGYFENSTAYLQQN